MLKVEDLNPEIRGSHAAAKKTEKTVPTPFHIDHLSFTAVDWRSSFFLSYLSKHFNNHLAFSVLKMPKSNSL
jgi:hypothetical protein